MNLCQALIGVAQSLRRILPAITEVHSCLKKLNNDADRCVISLQQLWRDGLRQYVRDVEMLAKIVGTTKYTLPMVVVVPAMNHAMKVYTSISVCASLKLEPSS
jgi:hypothetical protein